MIQPMKLCTAVCLWMLSLGVYGQSDTIVGTIGSANVPAGETFCVPITFENFDSIILASFGLKWDPGVFEYAGVMDVHDEVESGAITDDFADNGLLKVIGFLDFDTGTTLADGDTLFQICFVAVGRPGSTSGLEIAYTEEGGLDPEFDDINSTAPRSIFVEGSLMITDPTEITFFYTACPNEFGEVELEITAYGVSGNYSYEIVSQTTGLVVDNGNMPVGMVSTLTITNLVDDIYEVIVTEGVLSDIKTIEIVNSPINPFLSTIDPGCPDYDNGIIRLDSISPQSPDYLVTWVTPSYTSYNVDSIKDLTIGDYRIVVEDGNGCRDTTDVELEQDVLEILSPNLTPETCTGLNDGQIWVEVSGGSGANYNYVWRDEAGQQLRSVTGGNRDTLSTIGAGSYSLTVNNDGCITIDTFNLSSLKTMTINVDSISNVTCNGDQNGYIGINVYIDRNRVDPITFNWDVPPSAETVDRDTMSRATMLGPGTFSVSISDGSGCAVSDSFTITEPDTFRYTPRIVPPTCPDGMDGVIDVGFGISGGTEIDPPSTPYDYNWYRYDIMDEDTTSTLVGTASSLRNQAAGLYGLMITDANGCTDSTTFGLGSGPAIEIVPVMDLVCIGDSDAVLAVEGELEGNTIEWSTGQSAVDTIMNLAAGLYAVTVTEIIDGEECPSVDTFSVKDPVVDVNVIRPMRFTPLSACNEPDSGIIFNLMISGGPYEYLWPSLGDSITMNPAIFVNESGDYPFVVIDERTGCGIYDSVVVVDFPERVSVSLDTANVSCFGEANGSITVNASGRGGLFDFAWSTMDSTFSSDVSTLTDLAPGNYDVTVTEVTDTACQVPLTIEISEPDLLTLTNDTTNTMNIRCFGESNGQIGLIWEGGNRGAAPTIEWSGDSIMNTLLATNLTAGSYSIRLTDEKGCADSVRIDITEPDEIIAMLPVIVDPICNGSQTNIGVDTAYGGSGSNFTFSVNNGPSIPFSATAPVFAGEHLVAVFDEEGCSWDTLITITEPDPLMVDLGDETTVQLGDSVRLQPMVISVAPVAAYLWSPSESLSCSNCEDPLARPLDDQIYSVLVTDEDGCDGQGEILVRVDKARNVYIPNGFTPNGDGVNDRWQVFTGAGVNQIKGTHVFDRWGNLVFESGPESAPGDFGSTGWNGIYGGQLMSPGVYVYLVEVEFVDGRIFTYRGDVTMAH